LPKCFRRFSVYVSKIKPVFCHGQLYVALSRSGNPGMTKVMCVDSPKQQGKLLSEQIDVETDDNVYTKNIVYREALQRANNN